MTTYVVYGDMLFLTNFILDLALLIAVKRFGNFPDLYGAFSLPQLFWGNDRSYFTFRSLDGAAHYFWENNCFFFDCFGFSSQRITAHHCFYLFLFDWLCHGWRCDGFDMAGS